MSALIRESHANETQALFLSADGDSTISGNLTVEGATFLRGIVETDNTVTMFPGTVTTPALQIIPATTLGPPNITFRSNGAIRFSTLTLATVPQTTLVCGNTANSDVLTVGGAIIGTTLAGIGPSPTSLITATQNLTPAPVSPSAAVGFPVQVNVPTQAGWNFDVMARGIITLASGSSDPNDIVNIQLDAGTSSPAVWTYQFKPSAVGDNGNWAIRDRVVSDATTTTLFVTAQVLRAGASTANYNVSLVQLDATRVK
jgi:hypothetical protein